MIGYDKSRAALKNRRERSYPISFSPVVTHQRSDAPPFTGISKLLAMWACTARNLSGRRNARRWAYCAAPDDPIMRYPDGGMPYFFTKKLIPAFHALATLSNLASIRFASERGNSSQLRVGSHRRRAPHATTANRRSRAKSSARSTGRRLEVPLSCARTSSGCLASRLRQNTPSTCPSGGIIRKSVSCS